MSSRTVLETRFISAAKQGNLDSIRLLVESNPALLSTRFDTIVSETLPGCDDPYQKELEGITIFHETALHPRYDLMKFLLQQDQAHQLGLKNNTNNQPFETTPLHCAVFANDPKMIQILAAGGVNLEKPNNTGATAFIFAICWNRDEAAAELVNCGTDFIWEDTDLRTFQFLRGRFPMDYCRDEFSNYFLCLSAMRKKQGEPVALDLRDRFARLTDMHSRLMSIQHKLGQVFRNTFDLFKLRFASRGGFGGCLTHEKNFSDSEEATIFKALQPFLWNIFTAPGSYWRPCGDGTSVLEDIGPKVKAILKEWIENHKTEIQLEREKFEHLLLSVLSEEKAQQFLAAPSSPQPEASPREIARAEPAERPSPLPEAVSPLDPAGFRAMLTDASSRMPVQARAEEVSEAQREAPANTPALPLMELNLAQIDFHHAVRHQDLQERRGFFDPSIKLAIISLGMTLMFGLAYKGAQNVFNALDPETKELVIQGSVALAFGVICAQHVINGVFQAFHALNR